ERRIRNRGVESLEPRMLLTADGMISEIMYHPGGSQQNEFIELHNHGTTAADLTGWLLDSGVSFTFPARLLNPGQYLIVARNAASFAATYPGVANFIGSFSGDLDDDGEMLALKNASAALI